MIAELSIMLLFIGMGLMTMDIFVPVPPGLVQIIMMNKVLGMVFTMFGMILIIARMKQTGVMPLLDLPNTKRTILFHERRGRNPNTTIILGKLRDLEFIKSKNKLFIDTGGGFRIAGHDCRRTHETICSDIPEWLSQYTYDMKTKFGLETLDVYRELRERLQELVLNKEVTVFDDKLQMDRTKKLTIAEQLEDITILKKAMSDPKMRSSLLSMSLSQIKNLESVFFDGVTHNSADLERWIESSTPNELDALEKQLYLNDTMRDRNYADPGEVNWGKWVPLFGFLMICGALAAIMIQGAFGS